MYGNLRWHFRGFSNSMMLIFKLNLYVEPTVICQYKFKVAMVIAVLLKQSVLSSFLSQSHVSELPSYGEDYGAREVSELCTRPASQPHGNINSCKLQQ